MAQKHRVAIRLRWRFIRIAQAKNGKQYNTTAGAISYRIQTVLMSHQRAGSVKSGETKNMVVVSP
jgi:hypothetical protein